MRIQSPRVHEVESLRALLVASPQLWSQATGEGADTVSLEELKSFSTFNPQLKLARRLEYPNEDRVAERQIFRTEFRLEGRR